MKQKLFSILALLLMAATGAWAEEQVVYTLDGTQTASNNNYATAGVVNQDGITWRVTGNVNMNPWRIGGKNLNGVDRSIWSESSLDETVTKVTLEFGTANSITVNSITMMVAGDADFNNVIDTKAVTFSANNTVDVTPTEGKEWKNAYYRFVFNVTVEGNSNKFLQLKSIKFYNDPDAQQQGGGGTEPVAGTYTVTMKDGVKDADKWTVKVGDGQAQALPIGGLKGDGSETVTLQYTGRLKVKGVKATSDAAAATVPVETITLNKTATTITAGQTETLSVSSITPDNATDQTVTWSSDNEAVATVDADGKVTAVAAGTVTIYAEANDGSGVKGNCTVTVTPATITVTWNASDIVTVNPWVKSFTKDGITFAPGHADFMDKNFSNGGTFTTASGKFTKIEVTAPYVDISGTGWSGGSWTGDASSSVSYSGDIYDLGMGQLKIVFTIEPTN